MSTCAVMMVKNEADIIGTTIAHLLDQVDEVIVADNMSDDGTLEILHLLRDENPDRLTVQLDNVVGYWQSRKMTALARTAYVRGHEWLVPCDADEIWTVAGSTQTLTELLAAQLLPVGVVRADVYNHYATVDDSDDLNPVRRLTWRTEEPLQLPKVAVRLWNGVEVAAGNHGATGPARSPQTAYGLLEVHHYPYRSQEQFVSKAVQGNTAYRATDLERTLGQHWREYGERIEAEGVEAGGYGWFNTYFRYEYPGLAGRPGDPQSDLELAAMVRDPVKIRVLQ